MQLTHFDIGPNFKTIFSDELRNDLRAAISSAYNHAAEGHIFDHGDDKFTFGVKVWRFIAREIKQGFKNVSAIKVTEKNNRLRLQIDEYRVGFAKVGASGKEDINISFPNNMQNVSDLALAQDSQISMFEDEGAEIEISNLRNIVIAHMGNPGDGLCAIYACFPIYKEGSEVDIVSWAHIEKIWDINDVEEIDQVPYTKPNLTQVPVEIIKAPILKLKDLSSQVSE